MTPKRLPPVSMTAPATLRVDLAQSDQLNAGEDIVRVNIDSLHPSPAIRIRAHNPERERPRADPAQSDRFGAGVTRGSWMNSRPALPNSFW
jgi:hypothetical protein